MANNSNHSKSIFSLAGQSVGYGLGIVGRQLVVYLTLPLFTNHMLQAEFGVISYAVAVMAFANTITTAGLHGSIFRFYYEGDGLRERRQVLGSSMVMLALFAFIPALFLFTFSDSIAYSLLKNSDYASVVRLIAVLLVVDTLINYGYILLRIQTRPMATSLSNVFIVIAQMLTALILVYTYDFGAEGYLAGLVIGEILGLVLMVLLTRRMISFQVSRRSMTTLLGYGLPLLPAALSMWALRLADRTLIGGFVGLEQLAIYEIGYKMGMLVSLVIAPFQTAWSPFAFSVMNKPNAQAIYRDVLTALLALSLFVALGLVAFQSSILRLLAPTTYATALSVVGWIALSQVFQSSYMVLAIGPKISKKTSDLAIIAVLAALVNLLFNIILIPRIGIQGAAIATVIGYGFLGIGSYLIGQRSYPFSLDWVRLFKVALAAIGSYLLILAVDWAGVSVWEYYLGKGVAWFSFLFICILIGVVTPLQLRSLWQLGVEMIHVRTQRVGNGSTSSTIRRL